MENNIWIVISMAMLFMLPMAHAEQYYANILVSVNEQGNVEISGLTNHPGLQGNFQNYTSKSDGIWTLNISPEGNFSDFVYEIRLPENSAITYIKVPGKLSIENLGYLSITGTGKNNQLSLIVQYQLKSPSLMIWYAAAALLLIGASSVFMLSRKKKHHEIVSAESSPIHKINKESLTEREKQIVLILEKNPAGVTQSRLQKELNLPKASLSRNLGALYRKGIIIKTEKGMTNHISLKKA